MMGHEKKKKQKAKFFISPFANYSKKKKKYYNLARVWMFWSILMFVLTYFWSFNKLLTVVCMYVCIKGKSHFFVSTIGCRLSIALLQFQNEQSCRVLMDFQLFCSAWLCIEHCAVLFSSNSSYCVSIYGQNYANISSGW